MRLEALVLELPGKPGRSAAKVKFHHHQCAEVRRNIFVTKGLVSIRWTEHLYSMHFYLLVLLIWATPSLLIIDSRIDEGVIPAIVALAVAFAARTIRPGQADHLIALARPVAVAAAIPAIWIFMQMLPLEIVGISNPIWDSAAMGIGHPIRGAITVDPGFTLLSLARYFTTMGILFLSIITCLDRRRAEWVLFALTTATAMTALVLVGDHLSGVNVLFATANAALGAGALDSAALGLILSSASAIRAFERFETQRIRGNSSIAAFAAELAFCFAAFAACTLAIFHHAAGRLFLAATSGLAMLAVVVLIRRLGLGPWGRSAIGSLVIVMVISLVAVQPTARMTALMLPLTPQVTAAPSVTERILAASPWTGTGAGTFATLLPIYRDADEVITEHSPPNVATKVAVEAGRPAVWIVLFIAIAAAAALFRGALRRGRDSFYSAAGAGSIVTLVMLAFTNVGMLQPSTAIVSSAVLGLAFGQRLSRTI
jgi:hypothetical protein